MLWGSNVRWKYQGQLGQKIFIKEKKRLGWRVLPCLSRAASPCLFWEQTWLEQYKYCVKGTTFLPETKRTNKSTDTGVAFTSNINTYFLKTLLSSKQLNLINLWILNIAGSITCQLSSVEHFHLYYWPFTWINPKQQESVKPALLSHSNRGRWQCALYIHWTTIKVLPEVQTIAENLKFCWGQQQPWLNIQLLLPKRRNSRYANHNYKKN